MSDTPGGARRAERWAGRGLWVTFEGGDGVGKSTQVALLEGWLAADGRTVVRTREPGRSRSDATPRQHEKQRNERRADAGEDGRDPGDT